MSDLIAVSIFPRITPDRSLKREALLFDRIEIFGLSKLFEILSVWNRADDFKEWEFLRDSGFLADPKIRFVVSPEEAERPRRPIPATPSDAIAGATTEDIKRMVVAELEMEAICRDYAGRVRADGVADAVFLGDRRDGLPAVATDTRDAVLSVVLRQLPLPDESTPWEAINDFRADPRSVAKYRALRHWINRLAREKRPLVEVEEELLYLLSEYEQALKLHRIKATTGVVETLVTTSLDVLGNLASFNWGKAAKSVFDLRRDDLRLREAEQSAPGKEVAYLLDATKRFG